MKPEIGHRVKIRKDKHPSWGWGGVNLYVGKVGTIVAIHSVTPSKRVPDGLVYEVHFNITNKKTGKVGISKTFPKTSLYKLEK